MQRPLHLSPLVLTTSLLLSLMVACVTTRLMSPYALSLPDAFLPFVVGGSESSSAMASWLSDNFVDNPEIDMRQIDIEGR